MRGGFAFGGPPGVNGHGKVTCRSTTRHRVVSLVEPNGGIGLGVCVVEVVTSESAKLAVQQDHE